MKNQKIDRKSKSRRLTLALALATVAALGSGCGQQAYNEGTVSSDPGTTPTGGGITSGGTTTSGNGPIPNPVASSTTTNSSPNYSFHFASTGSGNATQVGGGAMRVTADSVLQVSITAGNGMPVANTGYTAGFNCEQFNITVGNITTTAFVKKNNYTDFMLEYGYMSYDPCQSAQTTWTYDFSGTLSVGHSEALAITINGMQIDNCRLYSDPDDGGCGMAAMYSTYSADGYISVTAD